MSIKTNVGATFSATIDPDLTQTSGELHTVEYAYDDASTALSTGNAGRSLCGDSDLSEKTV